MKEIEWLLAYQCSLIHFHPVGSLTYSCIQSYQTY